MFYKLSNVSSYVLVENIWIDLNKLSAQGENLFKSIQTSFQHKVKLHIPWIFDM